MPYKFKFDAGEGENHHFECFLQCRRCIANTANGRRCSRTVCIGLPLCWQHMLRDARIQIRESTIPNAGKGLFAVDKHMPLGSRIFKRGDVIAEYIGEDLQDNDLFARYPAQYNAPYAFEYKVATPHHQGRSKDCACVRSAASMINHTIREQANARFQVTRDRVFVKASKNIKNGDEIFVYYGQYYRFNDGSRFSTKPASRRRGGGGRGRR